MATAADAHSWAETRARELVAARLARGGACGDHPAAEHWRVLVEETLTTDPARLTSLVTELCDLGVEGVEARAWLPKRPLRARPAVEPRRPAAEVSHSDPEEPATVPPEAEVPAVPADTGRRAVVGIARTAALAILAGLAVKVLLLQVYFVPSSSMAPTLRPGDRLAVEKVTHRLTGIDPGDVVVFRAPPGQAHGTLVKRVVAEGGDEVGAAGGDLIVNGVLVEEPYLPEGTVTTDFPTVVVPEGHLFVLGDNRLDSLDSRMFGPVPDASVIGTPLLRVWPLGGFGPL